MTDHPHAASALKFFDAWNTDFPTMCASFHEYFAEDAIWWNTPVFPQVHGVDEAYEQILRPSNESSLAMDRIHVETLNIAQVGNLVYNERIDHIIRADGSVALSIPICGVIEFNEDGLIKHFRDYCDTTALVAAMAGDQ
ncbi:limonene-1,2-epoxide hydrolase family protein [Mycobacterium sp. AZCC_0083]|uniref:limonene-1,2-epoxide hydrolase family protein n=1 Tax=Mycobacterium sp. AZCC_0083 TaxID=2735882 RepID=UPI001620E4A6|nr:limonene-1,2-epoxide hydrolase family protein [Mycobacterium sp. AZCC_0083]MBB5167831.1 limonene-1,2-epoxide hydrolase [Mycobacterium sp. AZCC_0083]